MKDYRLQIFCLAMLPLLLQGCTLGPPPPCIGDPRIFGMGWLILPLIIILIIIFWKKSNTTEQTSSIDYLVEALNDINERLKKLSKRLDDMEKENRKK